MRAGLRWALVAGMVTATCYVLVIGHVVSNDTKLISVSQAASLVVGLSFLVTGYIAWARQPANRIGLLMTVVGYAWFSEKMSQIPSTLTFTVGDLLLFNIYLPALAHLGLAYPFGRLRSRREGFIIGALYVITILGESARYAFWNFPQPGDCTRCVNLLLIRDDPTLSTTINQSVNFIDVLLTVGVVGVITRRWVSMQGMSRRVMTPALWTAVPLTLFTLLEFTAGLAGVRMPAPFTLLMYLSTALLPIGFLVGVLRMRLAEGAVTGTLLTLGPRFSLETLGAALGKVVGDPTLRIDDSRRFASKRDSDSVSDRSVQASTVTVIHEHAGLALLHDRALREEPRLLATLVGTVRLAFLLLDRSRYRANDAASSPRQATTYTFISYKHGSDGGYVTRLAAFLASEGLEVWFDRDIATGERWEQVIRSKIEGCSAFIVVMTPEAESSTWVSREIRHAERNGRPILPLLLEGQEFFVLNHLQFEDVRQGGMPSATFVAYLRDFASSRASTSDPAIQADAGLSENS